MYNLAICIKDDYFKRSKLLNLSEIIIPIVIKIIYFRFLRIIRNNQKTTLEKKNIFIIVV